MTNPSFIHLFIHGISEATTVYQALFFAGMDLLYRCLYSFETASTYHLSIPHYSTPLYHIIPVLLGLLKIDSFFLFLPAIILFFFSKIFLPSFGYAYELSHIFVKLILTHTCTSTSAAKFFRILKQRQV